MPIIEVNGLRKTYGGHPATGYILKDALRDDLFDAIYAKLGVNDRAAAVATAYDKHFLP